MKHTLSDKKILIILVVLFLTVPVVLLSRELWVTTQPLPNAWSIAFPDPESHTFSFVLSNPGATDEFTWSIINRKKEILQGKTTVMSHTTTSILVDPQITDRLSKKVLIQVKDSAGNVRELFKVLH